MKRLLSILIASLLTISIMAVEKSICPTACGITVGQTTKTGKTYKEWRDVLNDYLPMTPIVTGENNEAYLGNFIVEGLHMSILNMELVDDTVYQITFYERSPYADCWESYKDIAFKLRDKYAHFEDVMDPFVQESDSAVMFYKTDGKTQILFSAYPNSITLNLTDVRLNEIKSHRLYEELANLVVGATGPNYDEKNKVTSIAGVRFGETRTNTINAFKQRGTFMQNENHFTYFSDVNFGGSTYNIATFFFQYDSKKYDMVLTAAKFEKNFYEWRKKEAVMMYEAVVDRFKEKYSNCIVVADEEDSKAMACGMLDSNYENGSLPPIFISLELGVSRGGDKFYYVTVSYFAQSMRKVASDDI